MKNLDYKGIKSTRLIAMVALTLLASIFLGYHQLSGDQWIDFIKWIFGTYAFTEGLAKGAEAFRDRGQPQP